MYLGKDQRKHFAMVKIFNYGHKVKKITKLALYWERMVTKLQCNYAITLRQGCSQKDNYD